MVWDTPSFIELKMDAEIGSYQDDFDPARETPIARSAAIVANEGAST
jgi:hypothetical protein